MTPGTDCHSEKCLLPNSPHDRSSSPTLSCSGNSAAAESFRRKMNDFELVPVLCLSSWRTRKSVFRNKDLRRWLRWLGPSLCNSVHRCSPALFHKHPRTMFSAHPVLQSSSQRWSSALVMILVQYRVRHRSCDALQVDAALLCVLCSCHAGKPWKIPRWSRRAVHIPLGRGRCWTWTLFSQPGKGKKKPQSSLNYPFWLLSSVLWSECVSPQSIW